MRNRLVSHLVVGCIGIALGWIVHAGLPERESRTPVATDAGSATGAVSPAPADERDTPRGQSAPSERADVSPEVARDPVLPLAPDSSSDAPAVPSHGQGESMAKSAEDPLAKLANTSKVWCRFEPGNGAWLREDKASMYELAYQGGPVSFESIDLHAGTARMTGSAEATGSLEGVVDALVTTSRSGLHFSAFNSRGELVVTTVFGERDRQGRNLAVMTTHGLHAFNGSFQTYGACDRTT